MDTIVSNYREFIGNAHFMKQLENIPVFPVHTFKEDENGNRVLLRSETQGHPSA